MFGAIPVFVFQNSRSISKCFLSHLLPSNLTRNQCKVEFSKNKYLHNKEFKSPNEKVVRSRTFFLDYQSYFEWLFFRRIRFIFMSLAMEYRCAISYSAYYKPNKAFVKTTFKSYSGFYKIKSYNKFRSKCNLRS